MKGMGGMGGANEAGIPAQPGMTCMKGINVSF